MRALGWGLKTDGSTAVRFVRGTLLAFLTGMLPLLQESGWPSREGVAKATAVGLVGFLAGWLRAGERNEPPPGPPA